MGIVHYIKEALKHPKELSTIFPSSRFLARTIADQIDYDSARHIVELGPGDGAITTYILERMQANTELYLIEVNESFCQKLRSRFRDHPQWDQLTVIQKSADHLEKICEDHDIEAVDHIVSGLPLTTLPESLTQRILQSIYDSLQEDGRYIQFQYSTDYRERIEARFGPIRLERVWLNILPAFVYVADK